MYSNMTKHCSAAQDLWMDGVKYDQSTVHRRTFGNLGNTLLFVLLIFTSRVSSWRRSRSLAFADLSESSSFCFCSTSLSCLSIQNCSSSCRFCTWHHHRHHNHHQHHQRHDQTTTACNDDFDYDDDVWRQRRWRGRRTFVRLRRRTTTTTNDATTTT